MSEGNISNLLDTNIFDNTSRDYGTSDENSRAPTTTLCTSRQIVKNNSAAKLTTLKGNQINNKKRVDNSNTRNTFSKRINSSLLNPLIFSNTNSRLATQKQYNVATRNSKLASKQSKAINTNRNTAISTILNQNYPIICSIYENPKSIENKIGMSIVNYNTGELILSEFLDSQIFIRTINRLKIFNPIEILLSANSIKPIFSKLANLIKLNIDDSVKIIEINNLKLYNSEVGLQNITGYTMELTKESKSTNLNLNSEEYKFEDIKNKHFALMATSALIRYINDCLSKNNPAIYHKFKYFRIKLETIENTMLIDSKTIADLQLIENNTSSSSNKNIKNLTVCNYLDKTCTKMGKRCFRNNLLQPLINEKLINMRYEAVKELATLCDQDLEGENILEQLRAVLKEFHDLDKLFSKLLTVNSIGIQSTQKLNYLICLKTNLQAIDNLKNVLNRYADSLNSFILKEITKILNNEITQEIRVLIDSSLNDDCTWAHSPLDLQNQKCYAVRAGANGLLDISRQIYKKITDEILQEIEDLEENYSLTLDHSFDNTRGYYIRIKKTTILSNDDNLPSEFLNIVNKKNCIECNTLKVLKLNARLKEVISEIILISETVIEELLSNISNKISTLFMVSEAISILDLLTCFTNNLKTFNYCIPVLSDKIILKNSRHPILERELKDFIPNDVTSIRQTSSLQIITGYNMSGKSVLLKQIALLTIMSQMGSPIPADYAMMPIFKKLHTRICNENFEVNSSNFSFEMKEMAYFLDDITPETLLIIDELGRNSSIYDGFAISLAITEFLLQKKCTVFLSTHFQNIAHILKNKPSVLHLHMAADLSRDNKLKMKYTIGKEYNYVDNPGIKIVSNFFEPEIIEEAYNIAALLHLEKKSSNPSQCTEFEQNQILVKKLKMIHNLVEILKELLRQDDKELCLKTLQDTQLEFIKKFDL
ncbi:hypothetical protein TBLA_0G03510 [Henningerozyma blattae CBS 6284]|uniref:DNA mismatch repair proteins mutS family domain-containing protein n=1 Tax=Henningerozyma blattae (strain ATCC 34711 / CBS 6284 / DSM 70876 / NBRC 10599 / NRRL Y-10934 / UCD 77-7) TaxID=1071380 RepID=I2H7D5_HENB6|nr:hypothetical protein TBLA_0G03510 [Tetrapisispora blattae CBS 6284]CCH62287.1 hypothetical protein TBLA_0G03510 [Tetrapisispora blattae CBS 6284]